MQDLRSFKNSKKKEGNNPKVITPRSLGGSHKSRETKEQLEYLRELYSFPPFFSHRFDQTEVHSSVDFLCLLNPATVMYQIGVHIEDFWKQKSLAS